MGVESVSTNKRQIGLYNWCLTNKDLSMQYITEISSVITEDNISISCLSYKMVYCPCWLFLVSDKVNCKVMSLQTSLVGLFARDGLFWHLCDRNMLNACVYPGEKLNAYLEVLYDENLYGYLRSLTLGSRWANHWLPTDTSGIDLSNAFGIKDSHMFSRIGGEKEAI